ncbi:hypothetical protein ACRRTK_006522 [Alexandromys fortis]
MASCPQGPSPKLPFEWEKAGDVHIFRLVPLTRSVGQNEVSGRLRLGEGIICYPLGRGGNSS